MLLWAVVETKSLICIFYETNTLLEQLETIVLEAEKADTFSQDDVNEIFRIMHTIKGSSAMMEYDSLATVSHRIEDLFFIIREKYYVGCLCGTQAPVSLI